MYEIVDIFEPIVLWFPHLLYIGITILCVCITILCAILIKRKSPYIKQLKTLDTKDSKQFAKDFSSLYVKSLKILAFNKKTLPLAQQINESLTPYKYAKDPPPLSATILVKYQKLCEIL